MCHKRTFKRCPKSSRRFRLAAVVAAVQWTPRISAGSNSHAGIRAFAEPLEGRLLLSAALTSPAVKADSPTPPQSLISVGNSNPGTFTTNTETPSLIVTTAQDVVDPNDNLTSLREAIAYADTLTTASTITFDPTVFPANTLTAITLNGTQLDLTNTSAKVTVNGLGAGRIAVDGNELSRDFQIHDGVTAEIDNLTITGGTTNALFGGGVYSRGSLVLSNDVFTANGNGVNVTSQGGGLAADFGSFTLNNVAFINNVAGNVGSAIYTQDSQFVISNSTFSGNAGYAIFQNAVGTATTFTVTNSTITGATTVALYFKSQNGETDTAVLTDDTVSGNLYGVYLEAAAVVTLNGDILSGNAADLTGTFDTASSYNLIGSGGNLANGANHNIVGVANPLLAPIGNYGGTQMTMPLLPGSAAFDAGSFFNDANGNTISADERGVSRPQRSAPDIGAFESKGFVLSYSSGDNQSTPVSTKFANPLAVSVTANDAGVPVTGGAISYVVTPASGGASASLSSATGILASSGIASVTATANASIGSYTITASAAGTIGSATYRLTNDETPSLVVTTSSDSVNPIDGLTSLREAIAYADTLSTNSTITFSSSAFPAGQLTTIGLPGGVLNLTNANAKVTIQGLGANRIAVSGDNLGQVFSELGGVTAEIDGLTVTGANAPGFSGGINANGNLTLNNDVITANHANTGGGIGAAFGSLTLNNVTVSGNTANQAAGIYVAEEIVTITNSTISGNVATDTGGIRLDDNGSTDSLTIVNSTIANNTASGSTDSAIRVTVNNGESATLVLTDDTISRNTLTGNGVGGVNLVPLNGGTINATLNGTIVSGNTANNSEADLSGTFNVASSHNLIGTGGTLTNGTNGNIVGVSNPLLAQLGNYGGTTQTMALLPGSPALDAGAAFDDANNQPITADERGVLRQEGAAPDIGAFESRGFTITATGGATQSTSVYSVFPTLLSVHVASFDPGLTDLTGAFVTFTAPGSGTSATFSTNPIALDSNGNASTAVIANSIAGGPYTVAATAPGIISPASFSLTNTSLSATIQLSNLTQTYSGSPEAPTVTTTPPGLPYTITYTQNGNPVASAINAGTYGVSVVINSPTYTGSTTGTLVINPATATINLSNLSQTYTGSPEFATVTTTPTGLAAIVTYSQNGNPVASPTNAGTYAVSVTINDPNYTGSTSGTLVISPATATINLSNLSQTYTGSPEFVTVTTTPSGLSTAVTYSQNGNPVTSPTNAGSYDISATIIDPNYTGSATGTLVINKADAIFSFSGVTVVYDGNPHPATGTATGVESPTPANLTSLLHVSYKNLSTNAVSTNAPVAVGNYAVLASFDGNSNYNAVSTFNTGKQVVITAVAPAFSNLSSPTIVFRTAHTTLGGKISAGNVIPTGKVTITLRGVTQAAVIQPDGSFSATFATGTVAVGQYTITYKYAGNANFKAATGTSTLTVTNGIVVLSPVVTPPGYIVAPVGTILYFTIEITDAMGKKVTSPKATVTATGITNVNNPGTVLPIPAGLSKGNKFTGNGTNGYTFMLRTTGLAAGTYLLDFTIKGDSTVHTIEFMLT